MPDYRAAGAGAGSLFLGADGVAQSQAPCTVTGCEELRADMCGAGAEAVSLAGGQRGGRAGRPQQAARLRAVSVIRCCWHADFKGSVLEAQV